MTIRICKAIVLEPSVSPVFLYLSWGSELLIWPSAINWVIGTENSKKESWTSCLGWFDLVCLCGPFVLFLTMFCGVGNCYDDLVYSIGWLKQKIKLRKLIGLSSGHLLYILAWNASHCDSCTLSFIIVEIETALMIFYNQSADWNKNKIMKVDRSEQ